MFKYLNIAPIRIVGMLLFVAVMIGFIIWVSGFRKKIRQLMKNKKYFLMVSGVILLICLGSLLFKGLNYGLDFTGGTLIQVAVKPGVTIPQVRDAIKEYANTTSNPGKYSDPKIQLAVEVETKTKEDSRPPAGKPAEKPGASPKGSPAASPAMPKTSPTGKIAPSPTVTTTPKASPVPSPTGTVTPEYNDETGFTGKIKEGEKFRTCIIQLKRSEDKDLSAKEIDGLISHMSKKLGDMEVMKVETVGATIGKELRSRALVALAIALFAQLIYITFRFGTQLRFGIAADIALIHDLIIMVGLYSLLGKPVDSPFLAAVLTIIGYSVMDTVVVFDRVRENLKLMRGKSYEDTVNLSLNQVITRTAATSFTTILTLFAIYYFGGETLNNFALALLIGAVAGTYSSLFIASPLIIWIDEWVKGREKRRVEARRSKLEDEAKKKAEEKKGDKKESSPEKKKDKATRKRRR